MTIRPRVTHSWAIPVLTSRAMRCALVCLLTLSVSCFCAPLAITHVTVIDATGRAARPEQSVVIRDGRIESIVASSSMRLLKGSQVIDGRGKFLIPGLWDMHTHLAGVAADPAWSRDALLPLLIANGITGIRDMGGDLEALLAWRRDIQAGKLIGPQIVASGPMLISKGRRTADQLPVADAEEARAAVRDLKQRGADFVKIISLPSREVFLAVAAECKQQNISFVGHVPNVITAIEASDAGMRSIEHGVYSGLGPDQVAALAPHMRANQTWFVPTLYSISRLGPVEKSPDDPLLAFVPEALRKEWSVAAKPETRERWGRQFESDVKLTSALHAAGVSILAGSDSLDRYVFPGSSLHEELALLVKAGLTPMEALQSATRDAARFLGRESETGTITEGRRADLVLLVANPLDDIHNTQKIVAVIRDGNLFNRAALDALLDRAKVTR